jgi:hypothetical protein
VESSEGGCLCGAVRYRVLGEPISCVVCHCNSCRRASGAAAVAWLTVDRPQLEWLAGRASLFRSSQGVIRRFCGICGSAIVYENDQNPTTVDITTASLDDPNRFPPTAEVWLEHKLDWAVTDPALARHAQGVPPDS